MNSEHTLQKALADPSCHSSLKAAIRNFIHCDPTDAANDTEWLAEVFRLRLAEVTDGPVARRIEDAASADSPGRHCKGEVY